MRPTHLLTLAALLTASGAAAVSPVPALPLELASLTAQKLCPVRMLPDYHFGFSYFARLSLAPGCNGIGRVRKTSTMSTKANGARYQPIKPDGSTKYGGLYSWTIWPNGQTNITPGEQWTWNRWAWEYWDGSKWRKTQ